MNGYVWLDGAIVSAAEARISPFDRGLLYGDELFETMRAYGGRIHLFGRHLARLAAGASQLGIPLPPQEDLAAAVRATLTANAAADAVVRLTVTRGVGGTLHDPDPAAPPTLFIFLRPSPPVIDDEGRGERIITLAARHRAPGAGERIKAIDYMTAVRSAPELRAAGVREGLLLCDDGSVACGTVSNIFAVIDGELRTPPLEVGILAGITRGRIIELAILGDVPFAPRAFDRVALLGASECFYVNSAREVVPVIAVDDHEIGGGLPGPVTLGLARAYREGLPDEELDRESDDDDDLDIGMPGWWIYPIGG
jgi:branched-subunit amino acid aminotransferase/4-amino-4-deoxychorismate lyase